MIAIDEETRNEIMHYGIIRKSGRYPWGSGKTPYERAGTFQSIVKDLRSKGLTDNEIAKGYGMTSSQFRSNVAFAKEARRAEDVATAVKLKRKGMSNVAIGKQMGIPDTTVGNLLRASEKDQTNILESTAAILRSEIKNKKYIDVGKGVELHMGISHEKLRDARRLLEDEGYKLHYVYVEQLGTGKKTRMKVLSAPDVSYKEVYDNRAEIKPAMIRSHDMGRTFDRILPPISVDLKRVGVRYGDEGGAAADGVIFVRPGVKDLSLGKSRYAQVRIAVNGSHYLKGMAMYNDDLPAGVDLLFNTNKKNTGNKLDAMKKMKDDPEDPFGSFISDQIYRKDANGNFLYDSNNNKIVESAMNIVNKEGRWGEWSKNLSSQMLSKQDRKLAKEQLDLAYQSKRDEIDQILTLTNPMVKKHLLEKAADSADASAVHLKAAHLPRQASRVILPVNSLKDNEIYAPTFKDGETVVLVRYPHGGVFEIPELKVNNRHPEARKLIGTDAPDAVGINSKVAERLSGADFDGDTVLVIPNNLRKVKTAPPLEGLKGFDPQSAYPGYEGMKAMTPKQKGMEMGKVSNLITDMSTLGAPMDEIERAVKHSMVVIDAEKHKLNYKQSAQDNGISALMKKYQGKSGGGASTVISRATSETRVNERKLRPKSQGGPIDPKTGKLVYVETGTKEIVLRPDSQGGPIDPKTGKRVYVESGKLKTERSVKLAETDDAHTLVSDRNTRIERIYADHSNRLKKLANDSRLELLKIKPLERSPSAARTFKKEVEELDAALNLALRNAPLERQAMLLGNAIVERKMKANPDMEKEEIKKLKGKAMADARTRVGAKKKTIEITPRQWEAIQAGAISNTKLERILENADMDKVRELATPRDKPVMTTSVKSRAMAMLRNGFTLAEVADQLGISTSTLSKGLSEEGDGNE